MNANSNKIVSGRSGPPGIPSRANQPLALTCSLILLGLALTMAAAHSQTFTTIKSFGILTNVTGFNPQSTLVQGPDGTLYGTARNGESFVAGTVFKVQPDGSGFAVLKWFTNSIDGANPYAGLTLSASVLYGTAAYGGSSNLGTVFKVNTDGSDYTVLKNFTGSDGANPYYAGLTLSNSVLYGATYLGGSSNAGTVFKLNTDGTGYTLLKNFTRSNGANPNAALTLSGTVLYGTTENGGGSGAGTVFKLNTDGTGHVLLHNFTNAPDGAYPDGVLTLSGSVLYGTTYLGGAYLGNVGGTLFKVNTDGTGYSVLKSFDIDQTSPSGPLPLSGGVLYGTASGGGHLNGAVFKINTDGTGYTVLKNFTNSPDGTSPYAGLMLSGSVLFGTTASGGSSYSGTVFKLNTDATGYTVLKNFAYGDGRDPIAGLTLSDGALYGTTSEGGSSDSGTVFKLNTDGTDYTVLKDLADNDGRYPSAGLLLDSGALYGTAYLGGSSDNGTVFKLNPDGTGFTVLRWFTNSIEGRNPPAELTSSGSVLYGITTDGGSLNYGTVFKVDLDGTGYTVLKNFTGVNGDGASPYAGLNLSGGTLYGTTAYGGSSDSGTVFKLNTDGTGYTVLKDFTNSSDGVNPYAGLMLSGSVLYGTTSSGGTSDNGTVFKINTDGTDYTVLKNFTGVNGDGSHPYAALSLSGSTLYGTTHNGGSSNSGTVFKVNTDGTGYAVLKRFTGLNGDGANPFARLTLSGSVLYGTTSRGGTSGLGTVFSLSLPPPSLNLTTIPGSVVLSWANSAFNLQSAPEVTGAYTNIPNATSPYTNVITGERQFFRLIGN